MVGVQEGVELGNEKINFKRIREPEEMAKVKGLLKGIVEKAKGETFAGHEPLDLTDYQVEREVERVRVFTDLDQLDQFREELKGTKRSVREKFMDRVMLLGYRGAVIRVTGWDFEKYRCVMAFDKSVDTLRHELQHIADQIVFGDGVAGDVSSVTSMTISKAALIGQQVLLVGSMLERNYHESQVFGAASLVFGLISAVSALRYLRSEGEMGARKS